MVFVLKKLDLKLLISSYFIGVYDIDDSYLEYFWLITPVYTNNDY